MGKRQFARVLLGAAVLLTARPPDRLTAQHEGHATAPAPVGPLGIPDTRMGSGTAWVPDASPMHAAHYRPGRWALMLHGVAYLQYDRQGGPRGDDELSLINWVMLTGARPLAGGRLQLRGMLSADPWTVGADGYPLLLQSGEAYRGAPLVDRQHPHDLFVELAAVYERPVSGGLAWSLYLAPVGEPALGPPAFLHRPSAAGDPFAPLGHHWQDATHIVFGVATAGLFTRAVRLEASAFNGREPDERRSNFDYAGRRLDSFGVRLSVNPTPSWSLAAWYGYLETPEELHPDESLHRYGVSALLVLPLGSAGRWSSALIYAANSPVGTGETTGSALFETNVEPGGRNSFFARVEYVQKTAEDLVVPGAPPDRAYDVGALTLGYLRELGAVGRLGTALGLRGTVNFVPPSLEAGYGSRRPVGIAAYLRVRPK